MKNLEDNESFEKVEEVVQEKIGICQGITHKEKHGGQMTDFKARHVARGLQEMKKLQSDSPKVAKESLKLLTVVAKKYYFELESYKSSFPSDKRKRCV